MGQLIEHAMLNKLDDALNEAITKVGGNTKCASSLMDYPDIISDLLTANGANIINGKGIEIDVLEDGKYQISANADAGLSRDIILLDKQKINKGEPILTVLEFILKSIPDVKVNSKIYGRLYKSDDEGVIHYVIDGEPEKAYYDDNINENTIYLALSIGKYGEPTFIDLSDLTAEITSAVVPDGSITEDKLSPEVKLEFHNTNNIVLENNTIVHEKLDEDNLLNADDANNMFNNIFK